jgi:hypothetical protein
MNLVWIAYDSHNKQIFPLTAMTGHSFPQRGFCDAGTEFLRIILMSCTLQMSRFPKTEAPREVGSTGIVTSCCRIQTMKVSSR